MKFLAKDARRAWLESLTFGGMKAKSSSKSLNRNPKFAAGVERALIRAEEAARRTARMYGTPKPLTRQTAGLKRRMPRQSARSCNLHEDFAASTEPSRDGPETESGHEQQERPW
jgi:hypothetical protein